MKKPVSFPELVKSASESVKRSAQRNGKPIAISEDGNVIIIRPHKTVKRIHKSTRQKQKK